MKKLYLCLLLIFVSKGLFGGFGNDFVFGQLIHSGSWDPYPNIAEPVLSMVEQMTNIPFSPQRQTVKLSDNKIFEIPFLLIKGSEALIFSDLEKNNFKKYVDRGGFVFFDDTLGQSQGAFAKSVRLLMVELYPNNSFRPLGQDHSIYRSFFLLRNVGGRRISEKYLEGLDVGGQGGGEGRTAVIYCPNDLLGAWIKNPFGEYTYSCEPGGEAQRWESFKLTINLIYFSLTGTYKRDAVHQPFIEQKLGF